MWWNACRLLRARLPALRSPLRAAPLYQAMVLGVYETAGLSWRLADQYAQRLQAVTPAQVQSVARRYFQDDGLTVAVLEPQPAAAAPAATAP